MHRFFTPQKNFQKTIKITDPEELHHLRNVLRIKPKDKIELFNGTENQAIGVVSSMNSGCEIVIEKIKKVKREDPVIILACALPKKNKFETIIEKSTELGIDEIIPIKTHRTEVDLKGDRLLKKLKRFETVAINAAKQCKRSTLPVIHPVTDFKTAVNQLASNTFAIIPSLIKNRKELKEVLPKNKKNLTLSIFIGPEGDFTDDEYAYAIKNGAKPVSLGKTTLKVETAAITTVGFCRFHYL